MVIPWKLIRMIFYEEINKSKYVFLNCVEEQNINQVININRYSKLSSLLRVTALVKRFIDNLKRKKKNQDLILHNYIIAEELDCILKLWIKDNQKTLINDGQFDNLKKSLFLQIDGEGIYRSMERIIKAELPYDTKVPIMLSTKHKLAELIVLDVHEKNMHVGVKHTITQLRSKFWITCARCFVKKLLKCCC